MGLIESVSAIEKYPEVSCGESVLTSQMVPTWSNHVGEMLGMSWFRMAFLTPIVMPGMIQLICPLGEAKEVFEYTLACLFPLLAALNGMPQRPRDAATAA